MATKVTSSFRAAARHGRSTATLSPTPRCRTSRQLLTANRTYYVRSDGSNSNDGLSNSSGGTFQTIAKAISAILALDLSIYNVTIQLGSSTWSESASVSAPWVGSGKVTLLGDATTPANVTEQWLTPDRIRPHAERDHKLFGRRQRRGYRGRGWHCVCR